MGRFYDEFEPYRADFPNNSREAIENQQPAEVREAYTQMANNYVTAIMNNSDGKLLDPSKYPTLAGYECHTEIEADVMNRLERASHSFAMQNKEFRDFFSAVKKQSIIEENPDPLDSISLMYNEMHTASFETQYHELAAKISLNEDVSNRFEQSHDYWKDNLENSTYLTLISCLEYGAGLSDQLPTDWVKNTDITYALANFDITQESLDQMHEAAKSYDATKPLERITFNPIDVEALSEQYHLQNPKNWNHSPHKIQRDAHDFPDAATADRIIGGALETSASHSLDPTFSHVKESAQGINRAKLITVGGKTVEEIMRENYEKGANGAENFANFDEYFSQNYKRDTHQIVASGMENDKRVEVFIPDKKGLVSEPVQMVKQGQTPTPVTPVSTNSWQKFMSKFGFYKDTMLRQKEYDAAIQKREQVKTGVELIKTKEIGAVVAENRKNYNGNRQQFIDANQLKDLIGAKLGISFGRGATTAFGTGALLNEGYSLEDIRNPNALQEQKRDIGRLMVEKAQAKDKAWFADTLVKGELNIINLIDQKMNGIRDFSKLNIDPNAADLHDATHTLFEFSQECSNLRPPRGKDGKPAEINYLTVGGFHVYEQEEIQKMQLSGATSDAIEAKKQELKNLPFEEKVAIGTQTYNAISDKASQVAEPLSLKEKELLGKNKILSGIQTNQQMSSLPIGPMISGYLCDELVTQHMDPNRKFSEYVPARADVAAMEAGLSADRKNTDLMRFVGDSCIANPDLFKTIQKSVADGTVKNLLNSEILHTKDHKIQPRDIKIGNPDLNKAVEGFRKEQEKRELAGKKLSANGQLRF